MSPTRRRLPRIPVGPLGGFKVTLKQMLLPRVTVEYPKEKRPKPPRAHGRHVLNRYEDGMEKCIGCELCAGVCPADCIYVRGKDNDPEHPTSPGERYGYVYEINYLRCIHCDLCVEACPTEAITESKLFEFSFTNRTDAIYTKRELVVDDEGKPRRQPWEDWREGDDLYTSAWMRATSPSGDPAYEGVVGWSGELGYGVRAPEGGQSGRRDDARTGNRSLREMLALHLDDWERPSEQRGLRGALQRARTRAERKLPGRRPPGGAYRVPPPAPPGLPEDQLDEPDETVGEAAVATPLAGGSTEGGEG